jgi:hypothetical protein
VEKFSIEYIHNQRGKLQELSIIYAVFSGLLIYQTLIKLIYNQVALKQHKLSFYKWTKIDTIVGVINLVTYAILYELPEEYFIDLTYSLILRWYFLVVLILNWVRMTFYFLLVKEISKLLLILYEMIMSTLTVILVLVCYLIMLGSLFCVLF